MLNLHVKIESERLALNEARCTLKLCILEQCYYVSFSFCAFKLPSIVFFFVLPLRMELSHVFLCDEIEIFLVDFLAFRVVVDPVLSIAFNYVLPEQPDRLVRDLSLSGTLFG